MEHFSSGHSAAPVFHEGVLIPANRNCHTQEEWDRLRYQNERELRELQLRSLTGQQ